MKQIPIQKIETLSEIKFADKRLAGKICLSPFVQIAINLAGKVRLCGCADWMPTTIGNLYENKLEDLLSSPLAQKIKKSITDGSYSYCNENTCGIIRNNLLNTIDDVPDSVKVQIEDVSKYIMPREIFIAGDITCNLSCPSCRKQVLKPSKELQKKNLLMMQLLKKNIFSKPTDQEITLTLSTTGELFSSKSLLFFLNSIPLNDFPNVNLNIQTNGLLCEKNWHKLKKLQDRVKKITVTIDAATCETYEKLRQGGKWSEILSSMQWLKNKKQENNMLLHTRMVVQKDNYSQILEFYKLSQTFLADVIEYVRLQDWHSMTPEQFIESDVLNPSHLEYSLAKHHMSLVQDLPGAQTWG